VTEELNGKWDYDMKIETESPVEKNIFQRSVHMHSIHCDGKSYESTFVSFAFLLQFVCYSFHVDRSEIVNKLCVEISMDAHNVAVFSQTFQFSFAEKNYC
jgi:hypothetical protein